MSLLLFGLFVLFLLMGLPVAIVTAHTEMPSTARHLFSYL